MYTVQPLQREELDSCIALLRSAYEEERSQQEVFPSFDKQESHILKNLEKIHQANHHHYALYDEEELVGFMMGHVLPSLWGRSKGFYVPLHAYAVGKDHRKKGGQLLYTFASKRLVKEGILSHAITLYYNDEGSMNTWFHLGFGLRLIDSIKDLKTIHSPKTDKKIEVKDLSKKNLKDFLSLAEDFHFYFEEAPLFMPQETQDEEQELKDFIQKEEHYLYGLYYDKKPISYIKLRPIGENLLTYNENFIHVCGLYVDPAFQSKGMASIFLQVVGKKMQEKGYQLLGVDFESFNTKGANFWHKHFTPYTYTLTRRIDEGIVNTPHLIKI